ncbi:hypothetical protein TRAPUB_8992 [Trametes pubescens]|uniref:Uncharacterized protein n=1 Tax=Trametes pubescens TaxID=154538 RepID=A0A1M2VIW3_TRAPU|nr:hypothetical protein TRAPUB_1606 [Trametes pubescens]OJT07541.1 hypothetical protein TRAPUB_1601 [Trametes pubescens]OJT07545.1 hypothetical protein TRAPUB_1605 [Trametes pubescens]OJT14466.1 hypothetical protein TRAPUB_8992 [Trametes pubescens]
MTEYDYSPEAHERFQAKMAGVGNWVVEQKHHAPKYSNPFTPEQVSSSSRAHTPSRPESSSRHYDQRPQPSRSRTLPAPPSGSGHTSRAYAYAQGPSDANTRHRSARSPQRSGSLPVDPRYATHVAAPIPVAPHQVVPRTSPVTYAPPPPPGVRTRQVEYAYKPGQPIVLPPPRPGETYVIIPPKGGRVDVIPDPRSSSSHTRTQSTSRSTSRGSSSKPSSPTKKNNEALLKRLLNNLTPTIEWGNSSNGTRSSSRTLTREPGRRRSTSR